MSEKRGGGGSTAAGGWVGAVLAIILSWTVNKSVLWAIIHAFCGWLYVIYWLIAY